MNLADFRIVNYGNGYRSWSVSFRKRAVARRMIRRYRRIFNDPPLWLEWDMPFDSQRYRK